MDMDTIAMALGYIIMVCGGGVAGIISIWYLFETTAKHTKWFWTLYEWKQERAKAERDKKLAH